MRRRTAAVSSIKYAVRNIKPEDRQALACRLAKKTGKDGDTAEDAAGVPAGGTRRLAGQPRLGLSPRFGLAHHFAALGAVGKRSPCRLGPLATLAHMVERCLLPVSVRLGGARSEELEIRAADDRSGQAYSACSSLAASGSPPALSEVVASSAACRFTAAILPRRSSWRS